MGFTDFIKSLFGDKSGRDLKKIMPIVDKIKAIYPEIEKLSNEELRARSAAIRKALADEVQQLRDLGAHDIILDPGFGFGKTLEENYALMAEMDKLLIMGLPLLVGVSRKSMIFRLVGGNPTTALNGTTVLNTIALMKGASILRVHDVAEAVEAVRMIGKMNDVKPL